MKPCRFEKGFCGVHGGATPAECAAARAELAAEDALEASKSQSQRFAEREAARMAAMTGLFAGGTTWAIDVESKTVRTGGIALSLTDLLVLHDALIFAAAIKCSKCGHLALVRGGSHTDCCGLPDFGHP